MKNNNLIEEWHNTKRYFDNKKIKVPQSIKYDICALDNIIDVDINNEAIIEIFNSDTFNLAIDYVNQGYNPLVLNMASSYKPGGGVRNGKTAQEEELFRRSNAHQTHPENYYPFKETEVIYSPQVTICKDSRDKKYKYIKDVNVSMIACAAIRSPKLIQNKYSKIDYNLMYKKIESIFLVGILHKHDCLVLGALGCGVYCNPSSQVAEIFYIMVNKYKKYFKKIGFAILVVKNSDKENLDTFKQVFSK